MLAEPGKDREFFIPIYRANFEGQQIIGIKRDSASCASIHYMIFAYCVTLHYFQISFKIKICKLVTTSCLTPSQPLMVISACDCMFDFKLCDSCYVFHFHMLMWLALK